MNNYCDVFQLNVPAEMLLNILHHYLQPDLLCASGCFALYVFI